MKPHALLIAIALPWAAHAAHAAPAPHQKQIERGRYLVKVGGCNDCHTPGYAMAAGKVAEKDWLVGDALGYQGPWGTTYASNLRTLVAGMTEQQWLHRTQHTEMRPPMPWFTLHAMRPEDLKAMYHFIRWLGPQGSPAPAYLPPGEKPQGPAVVFPAPPAQ